MEPKQILEILKSIDVAKESRDLKLAYEQTILYLENVHPSFTHSHHVFLAEVHYSRSEYKVALERCQTALSIFPNFIPALQLRIKIYTKLGEMTKAQADTSLIQELEANEQKKWDDPNHYYHYK